jgi:hypothetical protein
LGWKEGEGETKKKIWNKNQELLLLLLWRIILPGFDQRTNQSVRIKDVWDGKE